MSWTPKKQQQQQPAIHLTSSLLHFLAFHIVYNFAVYFERFLFKVVLAFQTMQGESFKSFAKKSNNNNNARRKLLLCIKIYDCIYYPFCTFFAVFLSPFLLLFLHPSPSCFLLLARAYLFPTSRRFPFPTEIVNGYARVECCKHFIWNHLYCIRI